MALRKLWLNVNGADRMFLCDPDKDTLADVIRNSGLTGCKVGCGVGQCGACSVIYNGKVIRACVKKISAVKDYDKVVTVEGIGTPDNLHPLQQAFITFNGLQCGFCTPGFIVSAKALLDENPNPTRQEVRDWFTKNNNLCRCTGYKQIVDSVMEAAAVMRGEKTMDDIKYKVPEDGKILGTNYPRPAALAKVTGLADYGDDISMKFPGMLHMAAVTSTVRHANIVSIDFSEALKMPGVIDIVTAEDIPNNYFPYTIPYPRTRNPGKDQPVISDKKVYKYGDILGCIVATTKRQAREAAEKVKVEYELLPVYNTALEAVAPGAMEIHEGIPNHYLELPLHKGTDTREVMPTCKYTADVAAYTQREPHLVLEPDCALAYMDSEGHITVQSKSQNMYSDKRILAHFFKKSPDDIRIIMNFTGASFGYSVWCGTSALAVAGMLKTGRPCSLVLTWKQYQFWTGKRTAAFCNATLGCDENGKLQALQYDIMYDAGGYAETSENCCWKGLRYFCFPYYVPNVDAISRAVYSNNVQGTAYRSFCSTQQFTPSEIIMDMLAEKAGIDPFEFRYINIARKPGETMLNGNDYLEYPMQEMMDKMRPVYEEFMARPKVGDTPNKKRGVGIAWGGYTTSGPADQSQTDIELTKDGITVYNCWEQLGQGADVGTLILAYEAFKEIGITPDQVKLVQCDTALAPETGIAGGSRSNYVVGNTIRKIADEMLTAMRKPDGTYRTYDEMVAEGIPTRYHGHWSSAEKDVGPNLKFPSFNTGLVGRNDSPHPEWGYIFHVCEVEVDVDTGKLTVLEISTITDIGVIANGQGLTGQFYSGVFHGVGTALKEDCSDPKKHGTIQGAGLLRCNDMPDKLPVIYLQNPRKYNPHGCAGASETMQACVHAAILNGIYHACGVRITEMPALPEKIKAALDVKAAGGDPTPTHYDFGTDMFDILDELETVPENMTFSYDH